MATELSYRGYTGSIEDSPEDGVLFGKVRYIRTLVNYGGRNVPELVAAFAEAVGDYRLSGNPSGARR